eukprot:scaffold78609_cov50-Phaeocystis_antarctica.AAC.1
MIFFSKARSICRERRPGVVRVRVRVRVGVGVRARARVRVRVGGYGQGSGWVWGHLAREGRELPPAQVARAARAQLGVRVQQPLHRLEVDGQGSGAHLVRVGP